MSSLLRFSPGAPSLLYLPITYAGMTLFDAMDAYGPGDTEGLGLYNDALRERGHSLEPEEVRRPPPLPLPTFLTRALSATLQLEAAIERHGGSVLRSEPSTWLIGKESNPGMWRSMLHFFGTTAAGKFAERGYDIRKWLGRVAEKKVRGGRPNRCITHATPTHQLTN